MVNQEISHRIPRNWWIAFCLSVLFHLVIIWCLGLVSVSGFQSIGKHRGLNSAIDTDTTVAEYVYFVSPKSVVQENPKLPDQHPKETIIIAKQTKPQTSQTEPKDSGPSPRKRNPSRSFFGVDCKATKIVYVLDASSSMGQSGAFTAACGELLAHLHGLGENTFFQILVYHSRVHPLLPGQPGWIPATTVNKNRVADKLTQLFPSGATHHSVALPLALSLRPELIFFITDADDLTFPYVRDITTRNAGNAIIHAVEFTTQPTFTEDTPLQYLARENRGRYIPVKLKSVTNPKN